MNVTLPNGFVMTGVPDSASKVDIAKHAIEKGYAQPQDFGDYPDIYSQLPNKQQNAPTAVNGKSQRDISKDEQEKLMQQAINSLPKNVSPEQRLMMEGAIRNGFGKFDEYQDAAPDHRREMIRNTTIAAAAPASAILGAPLEAMGLGATAANLTGAAALNIGADAYGAGVTDTPITGKDIALDTGSAIAPAAISKAASVVLGRLTPAAVQYLRGRLGHAELPEDIAIPEKYIDEAPVAQELPTPQTAKSASKTDRIDAISAMQEQWLDEYNQKIARRLVGVEAESYILNVLKPTDTAQDGLTAPAALKMFREFTEDYENPHLPFAGDERPELSGYGQFEQLMRSEHEPTNNLIEKIDAGEDVSPQAFFDAVSSYTQGGKFSLNEFLETSPHVNIKALLGAIKEAPETAQWLDAKGIFNPEMRQYVSAKQAAAHRAGVSDAYSAAMERLNNELSSERHLSATEYHTAESAGQINVQTALKHKMDLLNKMQKNVQSIMNDAKGIKANGVSWSDISEDERAVYWAMTHTHDAAARGAKVMRLYEQLEAVRAALPAVRAATAMDRALDNTAGVIGAGFMFGGPVGAITAPLVKATTEKATKAVLRKIVARAEREELIAAAKK